MAPAHTARRALSGCEAVGTPQHAINTHPVIPRVTVMIIQVRGLQERENGLIEHAGGMRIAENT